ncbi:Putative protein involved in the ligation of the heme to acytochromes c and c1 [Komagataella phaffii CBS 7435]|uniref:Mitochondrial peripheral inner membrane protein n=2 Tax=Komagataella phaffii TaxID=460519 RepID=C4QVJ9_KOMPG|nr:Mitochondrial peripheral inner membrane protein [Komagataella phaffii GS115]AOA61394.1 GQ67_02467T0 [Komagataella phaffii]CAH2445928.1 Putative protein involved in the ligation of the heme to acytochromes c and c1 [Komagataella phaffii CBS 7435]AOA66479.1 GQ68_02780T0 [Komagataella phaffii GS115]CAY67272.1 Mitochondrial peripheral inner membrane protein [Komagataella phaffii GS115]CCA36375.1 Putative protein involved in the ligation of the heme to acytochromes c and c1 [Komagataella phaffii
MNQRILRLVRNYAVPAKKNAPKLTGGLQPLQGIQLKKQYIPRPNQRVTYEHQPPPSPSELKAEKVIRKRRNPWLRFIPSLVVIGGTVWLLFSYNYFFVEDEDLEFLNPSEFKKYTITFKQQIDEDHYLIELTRKNRSKILNSMKLKMTSMWNGHRLWSVEIKQPDISIVRKYTPLPLYVASNNSEEPFIKIINSEGEEGKMMLYIKTYPEGEMARWISQTPLYSDLELRGPFVDYEFPFHPLDKATDRPQLRNVLSKLPPDSELPEDMPSPDNYNFFGAGTGISPFLQCLYSPNPPKGKVNLFHSANTEEEIPKVFSSLNYFLQKTSRLNYYRFIRDKGEMITDVPASVVSNYRGYKDLKFVKEYEEKKLLKQKMEQLKSGNSTDDNSSTAAAESQVKLAQLQDSEKQRVEPSLAKSKSTSYFDNALQLLLFKRESNDNSPSPASLSLVCGPEGYISYISGTPDFNNPENIDAGEVSGLLGKKGWTKENVKRLQ